MKVFIVLQNILQGTVHTEYNSLFEGFPLAVWFGQILGMECITVDKWIDVGTKEWPLSTCVRGSDSPRHTDIQILI